MSASPDCRLANRACASGSGLSTIAVEVRPPLVPVVRIALHHHPVAGRPRLQDERPGADRIAVVVVALRLDRRRRLHDVVCTGYGNDFRQVQRRIDEVIDDGQIIGHLETLDVGDIEGAAALVRRILLAVEIPLHRLGVERRAVVELHAGPQLERPGLVVLGAGPRQRELGLHLAVVVEAGQRVEDQPGGDVGGGVEDADLQRIETRGCRARGRP